MRFRRCPSPRGFAAGVRGGCCSRGCSGRRAAVRAFCAALPGILLCSFGSVCIGQVRARRLPVPERPQSKIKGKHCYRNNKLRRVKTGKKVGIFHRIVKSGARGTPLRAAMPAIPGCAGLPGDGRAAAPRGRPRFPGSQVRRSVVRNPGGCGCSPRGCRR